nr:caffeic acid 3-O-methyltransferase-like [Nicotiana tomentosiformis]
MENGKGDMMSHFKESNKEDAAESPADTEEPGCSITKTEAENRVDDVVQGTPDAELRSDTHSSIDANNRSHSEFDLKDVVLEGRVPFDRVHGVDAFEYPKSDPKYNDVFNRAMINHTILVMKKVLENYKGFENLKTLVDVGGGLGVNLKMITSKYPTIKGTSFDLPHVVQRAPSYRGIFSFLFYCLLCFDSLIQH